MHAVVFEVDMKEGWEGKAEEELDQLVGMMKSAPGFVRGTWANDGKTGVSFLLFESEEAAHGVADNASVPPEAGVTLRSVNVYEVLRDV